MKKTEINIPEKENDNGKETEIVNLKNQIEDLKKVLPAFCYLLCRIKQVLPNTQAAVIINTELKPEIENGLTAACEKQGIEYIKLENISKQNGHPDKEGMKQICSQVLKHFL